KERHDGKEYQEQDIPAIPGRIGGGGKFSGLAVTGGQSECRVTVAAGVCRALLGLDGRGRPSPHGHGWILGLIVRRKGHASSPVPVGASTPFDEPFFDDPLKYAVSA